MRTLIFDADALAYLYTAADQRTYDWGDGVTSVAADPDEVKQAIRDEIDRTMEHLKGDDLIIAMSDELHNFRKDLYPGYKASRVNVERPQHLYDLKEWIGETYPSRMIPYLEADDVMGRLATEPTKDDRIMVAQDKDMLTIPGLLYRPHEAKPKVREISLEAADRFHLLQTLAGDQTDEYPGCPGIGFGRGADHLDAGEGVEPYEHTFTRGPRKGQTEVRWRKVEMARPWDIVVSLYRKAGQTEADALLQARLARILRHGERAGTWVPN